MADKAPPFAHVRFAWMLAGRHLFEQDVVVCTPARVESLLEARPALRNYSRHDLSNGTLVVFLEDPTASGVLWVDPEHARRSEAFDRELAAVVEPPSRAGSGRRREDLG